jgi:hypothetical protein
LTADKANVVLSVSDALLHTEKAARENKLVTSGCHGIAAKIASVGLGTWR